MQGVVASSYISTFVNNSLSVSVLFTLHVFLPTSRLLFPEFHFFVEQHTYNNKTFILLLSTRLEIMYCPITHNDYYIFTGLFFVAKYGGAGNRHAEIF